MGANVGVVEAIERRHAPIVTGKATPRQGEIRRRVGGYESCNRRKRLRWGKDTRKGGTSLEVACHAETYNKRIMYSTKRKSTTISYICIAFVQFA